MEEPLRAPFNERESLDLGVVEGSAKVARDSMPRGETTQGAGIRRVSTSGLGSSGRVAAAIVGVYC